MSRFTATSSPCVRSSPDELMAHDERCLPAWVVVKESIELGTADPGRKDGDDHLSSGWLRSRLVAHKQLVRPDVNQALHGGCLKPSRG
jgi:hypothetical protein